MTFLWTRAEVQTKLEPVFSAEQTGSLLEVLDNIRQAELQHIADTRELKYGLRDLTNEVKKLAAGQVELVVAQQRKIGDSSYIV